MAELADVKEMFQGPVRVLDPEQYEKVLSLVRAADLLKTAFEDAGYRDADSPLGDLPYQAPEMLTINVELLESGLMVPFVACGTRSSDDAFDGHVGGGLEHTFLGTSTDGIYSDAVLEGGDLTPHKRFEVRWAADEGPYMRWREDVEAFIRR